jgi:hypothetical protein
LTVHSLVVEVPRASGVTAVSRALVAAIVVPPHSVVAPEHATFAVASDTETGPVTLVAPVVGSVAVEAVRFSIVVVVSVEQPPPIPWVVHAVVARLSRTPVTSPVAPPLVVEAPLPTQPSTWQSAFAPAVLDAVSVGPAGCAAANTPRFDCVAAVSPTCDCDWLPHDPPVVEQFAEALVSRTAVTGVAGVAAPAVAALGSTGAAPGAAILPVVAVFVVPVQVAVGQSTHAFTDDTAVPSPSTVAPGVVVRVAVVASQL